MHPLKSLAKKLVMNNTPLDICTPVEASSVYAVNLNALNGNPVHLDNFKGKKVLFVNVDY